MENKDEKAWEFSDENRYPLILPPPTSQGYIGFDISCKYFTDYITTSKSFQGKSPCLTICFSLLLFFLAQVWQEGELTAFKHYSDIGESKCPEPTTLNEDLQACCCDDVKDCCWNKCTLPNDDLPPNSCLKNVPNSRWIKPKASENSFHAIQNVGKYILEKTLGNID